MEAAKEWAQKFTSPHMSVGPWATYVADFDLLANLGFYFRMSIVPWKF